MKLEFPQAMGGVSVAKKIKNPYTILIDTKIADVPMTHNHLLGRKYSKLNSSKNTV